MEWLKRWLTMAHLCGCSVPISPSGIPSSSQSRWWLFTFSSMKIAATGIPSPSLEVRVGYHFFREPLVPDWHSAVKPLLLPFHTTVIYQSFVGEGFYLVLRPSESAHLRSNCSGYPPRIRRDSPHQQSSERCLQRVSLR